MNKLDKFFEDNVEVIVTLAKKYSNDGDLGRFSRVEFANNKCLFAIPNDKDLGTFFRKKINTRPK